MLATGAECRDTFPRLRQTARVKTLAAVLSVPVALLAGCSAEFSVGGEDGVDQAQVEQQVSRELEELVGQAPDLIECPGDLRAEEGTEMRCVLTAGEDRLGVTVTVTRVAGDDVDFDIEVDEEMME